LIWITQGECEILQTSWPPLPTYNQHADGVLVLWPMIQTFENGKYAINEFKELVIG
jgi:hypothetical protein